jgi:hypothetical protein
MSTSRITVPTGVVAQRVGQELVVLIPGRAEVVKLTGEAAEVFLDIQAGRTVQASDDIVSGLEAQGVIEIPGLSRRGLIKAGAIGAGAGIAVMAMPSVAAAASPSSTFEGEAYWGWLSFGNNGNYDTGTLRFRVDAGSEIFTAQPTGLTISGAIPVPTKLLGTVSSPIPRTFNDGMTAEWEASLAYATVTSDSFGDPLESFAPNPSSLTGTFSIPGAGSFTVVFELDPNSV